MFWDRFYELCKKNNTRPNPLAKTLGISSGTITKWKSGSIPTSENLIKIADSLDVSIDYLLERTDNQSIQSNLSPPVIFSVSEDEKSLVVIYRSMNEEGQERLLETADVMLSSGRYKKDNQHKLVEEPS